LSVLYFAYGTNMAPEEIDAWCPGAQFLGAARLDDYRFAVTRRSIRWGGGAADVVPAAGRSVWGALYELTDEALTKLDAKEGEGFAYRRIEVEPVAEGRSRRAVAYEVIDKLPDLACKPDYASVLLRAARERALPVGYLGELESVLKCSAGSPRRSPPSGSDRP
jgi:gamma-glutamylcyclotransferase